MQTTLVFVYGTLKSGYWNEHYLATDAEFLGRTFTIDAHYRMYHVGFPAVTLDVDGGYRIAGEVYRVGPHTLARLDALEANGSMYQREVVTLACGRRAYMYIWLDESRDMEPVEAAPGDIVWWDGSSIATIVEVEHG